MLFVVGCLLLVVRFGLLAVCCSLFGWLVVVWSFGWLVDRSVGGSVCCFVVCCLSSEPVVVVVVDCCLWLLVPLVVWLAGLLGLIGCLVAT